MLRKIVLAVLALVVVVLGMAAMKPDTFSVTRVVGIEAPPEKIAALITDFPQWARWSPWEKRDPDMARTFSGAARGNGAVYAWSGNRAVGKGRMEIIDARAPSRTVIRLDFLQPFEQHSIAEFTLVAQGDSTHASWQMTGPMPFASKLMSVFVSMDKLIGKDFEQGLSNLKSVAEK